LFPFFEFFSQFSSCDSRKLIFISLFFSYVYYDFALNVLSFFSKFRLAAAARKKEGKKQTGGSTKKTKKNQSAKHNNYIHFKTTFVCPRSIAGVPSSQALTAFLITAPPSVLGPHTMHALAL